MYLQETEILNILRNKERLLRYISEKRRSTYKDLEYASEEITKALSLRGNAAGEQEIRSGGGGQPRGLDELLEARKKKEKEYQKELYIQLELLERERERIQRVWICYQALPLQQYDVLRGLYIDGKLWAEIEADLGLNHRILVGVRKAAVKNIQSLYESNYSNVQIIELKYHNQMPHERKKDLNIQLPGQFALDLNQQDREGN